LEAGYRLHSTLAWIRGDLSDKLDAVSGCLLQHGKLQLQTGRRPQDRRTVADLLHSIIRLLLLLGNTEGSSSSAGGESSLPSDLEAPVVSESSVVLDLLELLEVLSELGVDSIGDQLRVGPVLGVSLSVQEPVGDSVLGRSGEDVVDGLDLGLLDLSGSLVGVDAGSLEDHDSKSSADTLDGGQGEPDLDGSLDVGVLDSENMREVFVGDGVQV
jgi:hypothetical protein